MLATLALLLITSLLTGSRCSESPSTSGCEKSTSGPTLDPEPPTLLTSIEGPMQRLRDTLNSDLGAPTVDFQLADQVHTLQKQVCCVYLCFSTSGPKVDNMP
ncbi:hypothetical protein ElyMa_005801500 [Elysia marginata]|uniref:Uncharacterized protein n=1 Tax=Elysia marginata TaxID=1093978 RepID=A0AAV4FUM3_9GAST|nr:hypothetical protein ElyMa_005801500 [Elysia marginata]